MRIRFLNLIVLFMLLPASAEAQRYLSVKRKDFKASSEGFREAWSHIKKGDQYFAAGGIYFANAYDEYLKASLYNSSNARLNYNMGLASLLSDNKTDAAGYLIRAYELDKDISKDIHLTIGQALHYSGNYKEAIESLNRYLASEDKKPGEKAILARKQIEECKSALTITGDTLKIGIINLGPNINTLADEYSEVFSSDMGVIYFGSRQGLPRFSDYYKDSKFDENIFTSSREKGAWGPSTSAGKEITTVFCESPLFMGNGGMSLFMYAGYENGGDIMISEYKKGQWGAPKKVDYKINSTKKESSFTVSPSGKEICYVSESGKPNLGGKDIFMLAETNGKWSDPVNMGTAINTEWDEESVSFSQSGDTLWFSSQGHSSIGGFDIFYSVRTKDGAWSDAVNAGYPLNTPFDELFYLAAANDDSVFYFVSNRSDGFGGLDIYEGRILPPPEPEPVIEEPEPVKEPVPVIVTAPVPPEIIFFIKGKISDSETGVPVAARIDIIEIATNQLVATATSSATDGSYSVKVPDRKSYLLELRSQGFLSDLKHVSVPQGYNSEIITFNATLSRVKVGKKVVLNNILFETGKAILTASSVSELNRLLSFMQDNPKVKVEISGHTDITGSGPLNLQLSNDRAKAVVTYLTQKGIASSRITYRGFGSSQPVATNSTATGRAKNRRVEMKILEI